jgi:biopolymer transport protein ExbB/TolQ
MADTSVSSALVSVVGGLVSGLVVLFATQYLLRWREDRTKRIQLTIEHAEKQLSEFYSPLLALVEQLAETARARVS